MMPCLKLKHNEATLLQLERSPIYMIFLIPPDSTEGNKTKIALIQQLKPISSCHRLFRCTNGFRNLGYFFVFAQVAAELLFII